MMNPRFMGIPAEDAEEYEPDWLNGDIIYSDDWCVDLDNQIIFYVGEPTEATTVQELYSKMLDMFDDIEFITYQQPITAITPHSIIVNDEWEVPEECIKFIKEGSVQLEKTGDLYATVNILGSAPLGVVSQLYINGATHTTGCPDGDSYQEMLKLDGSGQLVFSDQYNLVSYTYVLQNMSYGVGIIHVPNPLCHMSSVPKSMVDKFYDTKGLVGKPDYC